MHPVAGDATPPWRIYADGDTEMSFGRNGNAPNITAVKTDAGLLARCGWVLLMNVELEVVGANVSVIDSGKVTSRSRSRRSKVPG